MSKEDERIDKKTLIGERTYRVSTRMEENHPQIRFFVSPVAHRLYHLQMTLYPEFAGKKRLSEMTKEEKAKLPKGYMVLDLAITKKFLRDLANYARTRFHTATQEELLSSKFRESRGKKRVAGIGVDLGKK